MPTHLYLSPHFDDAVLSCGGLIASQTSRGERVVIATTCAGDAGPGPFSPFAAWQHERWLAEHPDTDAIALRRAEDRSACARLGAEVVHLDDLDCIYRRSGEIWLYDTEEALFGPVHPDDDDANLDGPLQLLLTMVRPDAVYAPLAVGAHVDHQRVRCLVERWTLSGVAMRFYEDYPYVERVPRLWQALNKPVAGRWLRHPMPLTPVAIEAKILAIACYASQLGVLFHGDMPRRVRSQLHRAGAPGQAEVLWQLVTHDLLD